MKSDSEQKTNALPEKEAKLWNFFVAVGVQGADELRQQLDLDELNFRGLAQ